MNFLSRIHGTFFFKNDNRILFYYMGKKADIFSIQLRLANRIHNKVITKVKTHLSHPFTILY